MIVVSLALLGFAVADLIRWSPEAVPSSRAVLATAIAIVSTASIAALSGRDLADVALTGGLTLVAVGMWVAADGMAWTRSRPGAPLAWILGVVLLAFALSASGDPISGPLEHWYVRLPFAFANSVSVGQFVLGVSVSLFLLATTNRIVRLVLIAAKTLPPDTELQESSEGRLAGGRLLGPMERLLLGAMVLTGSLTGAALIITAKGILRLPEIRSSAEQKQGASDQVTEYFLIGTFCSLLVASALAALVSGSG